jgi:MerR family mercuric resistance operon transcriptional regulator
MDLPIMPDKTTRLTIGAFAKLAGVSVETIRFYQRKGLLPQPDKFNGKIRRYGEPEAMRVRFIRSAQQLGFSLNEIASLLTLDDGMHCDEARLLAEHKLKNVQEKLTHLHLIESVLIQLIDQCHNTQDNIHCPLINALQQK